MRRFDGDGDVHLTISSIAVGNNSKSLRSVCSWSGFSASASSPPAMELRVVSAPALNSRWKNRYSSASDSAGASGSSMVALATTDSMSSAGSARLPAISSNA
ncbi:Uncharacterised protein [Mycobacterium tuberculosis]|uniref:Uncharacterized protein n=1 Tax=Mycobacterium tuberculosis TaxID=1773 RepID=A0A655IM17_MYCTX|nr:Uncharacterised protein [Mycobacterium tuberculosis]COX05967.1 Uncharacterised protein [Mycobacterium tuberculosis]